MFSKIPAPLKVLFSLLLVAAFLFTGIGASSAQDVTGEEVEVVNPYFTLVHQTAFDGKGLVKMVINAPSRPPAGYKMAPVTPLPSDRLIRTFPSYSWVFGCSAVSGAMIAGYYDRMGYSNMYTGPTAGGIMPLTDKSWPKWTDSEPWTYPSNPLIASRMGTDGLTTKGSIDDYWVMYGSYEYDPFIKNWTEHTWSDAIGDYMKTSQYMYYNSDGSTSFYLWSAADPTPLTCDDMAYYGISDFDGTFGRKQFYEARGFEVTDCYAQYTDNIAAGGFSLAQYKAEINAGHPVFINISGHSIVGYGYGTGNTIYIRDTWSSNPSDLLTMEWGGSYYGMQMYGVSIVKVTPPAAPVLVAPMKTIRDTTPTYKFSPVWKGARYQVRVFKGMDTKSFYTAGAYKSICASGWCKLTPTKVLPAGVYTWQARAYVNGVWQAWSTKGKFTIK